MCEIMSATVESCRVRHSLHMHSGLQACSHLGHPGMLMSNDLSDACLPAWKWLFMCENAHCSKMHTFQFQALSDSFSNCKVKSFLCAEAMMLLCRGMLCL